jgi:hypothetical protein
MGMMTSPGTRYKSAGAAQGAYSIGTSSFPVTGFPISAYRGNNSLGAPGGVQGQPSTLAGMFSNNAVQLDNMHVIIVLAVLAGIGYFLWHLDNKR